MRALGATSWLSRATHSLREQPRVSDAIGLVLATASDFGRANG